MRKRLMLVTAALALSLLALGFTFKQSRPVWEYKALNVKLDAKTERALNDLGVQGWELVSYSPYQSTGTTVDAGTFFFKRQK